MEMLNAISSLLVKNDDLWKILISWFASFIVNYGWAIILFTICLKLVLTPLDFFQRKSSQKQAAFSTAMKPEMDALQQKYGNDREKLNAETAKLYKKYNFSMGGMCLSLLLTTGVTMLVFFTLFGSLRTYGKEKLYETYHELDSSYVQATTYTNEHATEFSTDEEKNEYVVNIVKEKYNDQKQKYSWLWVKNVFKGDVNTSQFADVEGYIDYYNIEDANKEDVKARYEVITEICDKENPGQNGYYILVILSVAISFLTQFLLAKLNTPKGQKMNSMNLIMFIVIPLTMLTLVLNSNVVFALYTITNSIMSAIISTILTLIFKSKNKNKPIEEIVGPKKSVEVVEYSRNYKK